ncbi:MAG: YidC/Oxa1 family membrane protein insertase [bacterium]|nr:YidC/Oxa1 family membrane protein insertase [bacterium]
MGELFNELLFRPIINILVLIYQVLLSLHIPYALGFSIILLTILIRFVLYPLTTAQLKSSKKMQDIAPHLSNLKAKHKNDAKKLQAETMKLYKEHGVNPASGCLPIIIQLPLIWTLYSVLQKIVMLNSNTVSEVNKYLYNYDFLKLTHPWNATFFGLPLGQNPSHLISTIPLIILVPLFTGVFQFVQSKMMIVKQNPEQTKEATGKEEKKQGDFASAFQTQSLYIFPAMIGFFSYSFPIGLSLYWNTFTIFGILQQYRIQGWGGLFPKKSKILTT